MLGDAHVNPVRHAPYNWPGRTVGSGDNRPETTNRLIQPSECSTVGNSG